MLALSIRQPYAELILRGIKTVELRSRSTRIVGERFYIYASKGSGVRGQGSGKTWSRDLSTRGELPEWMIELAEQVKMIEAGVLLPTGVIVGSAIIQKVTPPDPADAGALFRWHLVDARRAKRFRKPRGHPQPVWFNPFD
jgi:hypothetical protein